MVIVVFEYLQYGITSLFNYMNEATFTTKFIILVQFSFLLFLFWVSRSFNKSKEKEYTDDDEEDIINNFEPEDLIEDQDILPVNLMEHVVTEKGAKFINVNGVKCLNFSTHNYLCLQDNEEVVESAVDSVRSFGVGSCGPRGFYGTFTVHLELEEKLAKFMGLDECIVYSFGNSTIASAIAAYAKRKDIVFVDVCSNVAIQKGIDASKCQVKYFKHNDVEHLEYLLKEQAAIEIKNKQLQQRKFLIVEGIYMNTGMIVNLPALMKLKDKYKLRIIIDESISIGVLGATGRGVTEYFNIPISSIDLISGSLETAIGSVGGFCVGSSFVVDHQRLSGTGYCFSASLPPLLTSAAVASLNYLEKNYNILYDLQKICIFFHNELLKSALLNYFDLSGSPESPVKHLILNGIYFKKSTAEQYEMLLPFIENCSCNGVALIVTPYVQQPSIVLHVKDEIETYDMSVTIRLTVNVLLTKNEILEAIKIMETSLKIFDMK